MDRITRIKNLLFYPNTFFSEITKEKENLTWPAVIVMFGGISTVISAIISTAFSHPSSVNSAFVNLSTALTNSYIFNFIIPFVMWAVASVAIYAISRRFSGRGSLKATFQNIGYGTLPTSLFWALSYFLTTITILTQTPITSFPDNPFVHASIVFGMISPVFFVWSWYLWVCGARQTHEIPLKNAILAVAFAVVLQGTANLAGLYF